MFEITFSFDSVTVDPYTFVGHASSVFNMKAVLKLRFSSFAIQVVKGEV